MVSPFGGSSTALKFLVGHLNKGIHSFIHSFVNIKINVPTNHIESGKICHTCRSSYPLNYSKACNFQESMTKNKTQSILYLTFFLPTEQLPHTNNCLYLRLRFKEFGLNLSRRYISISSLLII